MGSCRIIQIKPGTAGLRKPGPRGCKTGTSTARRGILVLASVLLAAGAACAQGTEVWNAENLDLDEGSSVQLEIGFDQIPVRAWTLVVDGGDRRCDVHVRRGRDGSLLYQRNDERHHEVEIPWGLGETVSIVVSNRHARAPFVVSLVGPPQEQNPAAYSYHVNRALETFAAGRRLDAEDECRAALRDDPDDGVAKVLLAGILRDRHYYDQAAAMVDEALAGELSGPMREVARGLQRDLVRLRAPLPLPVRRGVEQIEDLLDDGDGASALAAADKLLAGGLEMDAGGQAVLQMLRGRSLVLLDRNFEALDAFTAARQLSRDKGRQAVISFHMGVLFLEMENLAQAEGAFSMAVQDGLPSGLEVQAREHLRSIADGRRDEP